MVDGRKTDEFRIGQKVYSVEKLIKQDSKTVVPDVNLSPTATNLPNLNFHITDDARKRVENGLSVADDETLDRPEADSLHQLYEPDPGLRERGFCWILHYVPFEKV